MQPRKSQAFYGLNNFLRMKTSLGSAIVLSATLACSAVGQELLDSPGRGYREQLEGKEGPWLFRQERPVTISVQVPISQIRSAIKIRSAFKLPVIQDPDVPFIPEAAPALKRFDEPIQLQLNRPAFFEPSAVK